MPLAVGLTVLVVLALVAAGGVFFLRNWVPTDDAAANVAASASPSDTPTVQSTPTLTPSAEPTPSDTPEATAPVFTPVDLTLEDATLQQECKGRGGYFDYWHDGASPIAGRPYVAGFSCELKPAEATGHLDFLVPVGASRLTAVVGQRDDSQETSAIVRFEVRDVVTGKTLVSHDLPFGTSKPIDISVENLPRIRLQVSWLKFETGSSGKSVTASWAEPTFR